MSKKINILIKGIHCKSCKAIIESELEDMDGITSINVDADTGESTVEFDETKTSQNTIFKAIKKLNYNPQKTGDSGTAGKNPGSGNYKIYSIVGIVIFTLVVGFVAFAALSSSDTPKKTLKKETIKLKVAAKPVSVNDGFLGDRGTKVTVSGGKINIAESEVSDGNLRAYNYYSEKSGKNIYFFVVKASDGTYRAAANGCEVCHGDKKGFSEQEDQVRCDNCRINYSKDNIAMEKGGCNPGPIDKNVIVTDGNLSIDVNDVEAVAYLF